VADPARQVLRRARRRDRGPGRIRLTRRRRSAADQRGSARVTNVDGPSSARSRERLPARDRAKVTMQGNWQAHHGALWRTVRRAFRARRPRSEHGAPGKTSRRAPRDARIQQTWRANSRLNDSVQQTRAAARHGGPLPPDSATSARLAVEDKAHPQHRSTPAGISKLAAQLIDARCRPMSTNPAAGASCRRAAMCCVARGSPACSSQDSAGTRFLTVLAARADNQ